MRSQKFAKSLWGVSETVLWITKFFRKQKVFVHFTWVLPSACHSIIVLTPLQMHTTRFPNDFDPKCPNWALRTTSSCTSKFIQNQNTSKIRCHTNKVNFHASFVYVIYCQCVCQYLRSTQFFRPHCHLSTTSMITSNASVTCQHDFKFSLEIFHKIKNWIEYIHRCLTSRYVLDIIITSLKL